MTRLFSRQCKRFEANWNILGIKKVDCFLPPDRPYFLAPTLNYFLRPFFFFLHFLTNKMFGTPSLCTQNTCSFKLQSRAKKKSLPTYPIFSSASDMSEPSWWNRVPNVVCLDVCLAVNNLVKSLLLLVFGHVAGNKQFIFLGPRPKKKKSVCFR